MSSVLARSRRSVALVLMLAAVVVAGLVTTALAGGGGPRPITPKQGKVFARGATPTFRVAVSRANAKFGVFMYVNSRKRVRHGQLQAPSGASGDDGHLKRAPSGLYTYRPPHFTFPTYYMQRPGTYYWQSFYIRCNTGGPRNCHHVGPIRHFRVR